MRAELSNTFVQLLFFALIVAFVVFMIAGMTALAAPMAIAFLIAFALNPLVNFLESLGLPRALSAIAAIAFVAGALALLVNVAAPAAAAEFASLAARQDEFRDKTLQALADLQTSMRGTLPQAVVEEELDPALNLQRIESVLSELVPSDFSFLGDIVTYLLITPIITVVFLLQGNQIFKRIVAMVPNRYFEMTLLLVNNIQTSINRYFRGLGIQWCIMASITVSGFALMDLPYGPALGLVVATVNVIPYLGPLLGLAPSVAVALLETDGALILPVLIVIAIAQLVDNVFTQPVVLAGSVSIHPIIAILSVITLQQYFGMVGMVEIGRAHV